MSCILLTTDLMLSSQVAQAARDAGISLETVASPAQLLEAVGQGVFRQVIIDLNLPDLDPADVARRLVAGASEPAVRRLAIGPHVHRGKLDAARTAGWQVVTRGQFHAQPAQYLQ